MMTFDFNLLQAIASLRVFAVSDGNWIITALVCFLSLLSVGYNIVRRSSVFLSHSTNLVE